MSELPGSRGAPQEGVPPVSSQEPIRANQDVRALPTSASVIGISTPGAPSSERSIPIIATVDVPTAPSVAISGSDTSEAHAATNLQSVDKPETAEEARDTSDGGDSGAAKKIIFSYGGPNPEADGQQDTVPSLYPTLSADEPPIFDAPDPHPDEDVPQPDLHEPIEVEWEEVPEVPFDGHGEDRKVPEPDELLTADAIEKTLSPVDQLRLGLLRDTILRPVSLGDTETGTYIGSSTVDLDDWMDPPRPDHIQHQAVALDTPNTINVLYITRSDRRTLDEAKTGRLLWAVAGDRISPQEMFALYNEGYFSKLTGKVYRPDGWEWTEG